MNRDYRINKLNYDAATDCYELELTRFNPLTLGVDKKVVKAKLNRIINAFERNIIDLIEPRGSGKLLANNNMLFNVIQ